MVKCEVSFYWCPEYGVYKPSFYWSGETYQSNPEPRISGDYYLTFEMMNGKPYDVKLRIVPESQ